MQISPDQDLFSWAANQPTAAIIHAEEVFERKAVEFVRRFVAGHGMKRYPGHVIDLAEVRLRRAKPLPVGPDRAVRHG